MAVVPAGAPYWVGTASPEQYGGNENKRNYLQQGAIDPETDVTAEQLQRLAADLAAIARVAPFATLTITCNDTTPAAPTITYATTGAGGYVASYEGDSPPTGFPSASRLGDGSVRVTFATTYTDAFGVVGALSIKGATSSLYGATVGSVQSDVLFNVIDYTVTDNTAAAIQDATFSTVIYSGGG